MTIAGAAPAFACCLAVAHLGRHSRWKRQDQPGRRPNTAYNRGRNVHLRAGLCARSHPERSSMVKTAIEMWVRWPIRGERAIACGVIGKGPAGRGMSDGRINPRPGRDHLGQCGVAVAPVDVPQQLHAEFDDGLQEPQRIVHQVGMSPENAIVHRQSWVASVAGFLSSLNRLFPRARHARVSSDAQISPAWLRIRHEPLHCRRKWISKSEVAEHGPNKWVNSCQVILPPRVGM